MSKMIFINLPVADVAKSTAFYQAIGFEKNAQFSNEQASAMVWSEAIYVMLLDHKFYATFTDKPIIDAKKTSGALLCLTFEDRVGVDEIHRRVVEAGGAETRALKEENFMYGGAFDDPDGHGWETVWMDMKAIGDAQP